MNSLTVILPATNIPNDTAGLMWHPETFPIEYAMATIDKPNANAINNVESAKGTSAPLLATSVFAATALPQPKITNTAVPINSAMYFFITHFLLMFYFCHTLLKKCSLNYITFKP